MADDAELKDRLCDLGLTVGATVEVVGQAPFKGPLLIKIKGAVIAMRQSEAECVILLPHSL